MSKRVKMRITKTNGVLGRDIKKGRGGDGTWRNRGAARKKEEN